MKTIMIANRTGGVGKTTVTDFLHAYLFKNKAEYGFVSLDADSNSGKSKLKSRYGDDVLSLSPTFRANSSDNLTDWNTLLEIFVEGNRLIDFGANASVSFLEWVKSYDVSSFMYEDDKPVYAPVVLIPITSDEQPIADAISFIKQLEDAKEFFPIDRIVLIKNNFHSDLDIVFSPEVQSFLDARKNSVSIIRMKRCYDAGAMASLARSTTSMFDILKTTPKESFNTFPEHKGPKSGLLTNTIKAVAREFDAELDRIDLMGSLTRYDAKPAETKVVELPKKA